MLKDLPDYSTTSASFQFAATGEDNVGASVTTRAVLLTTMRAPTASPSVFDPNGSGPSAAQTQTVTLDRPATVNWLIRDETSRLLLAVTPELPVVPGWAPRARTATSPKPSAAAPTEASLTR